MGRKAGLILISAKVQGIDGTFILDTGAQWTVVCPRLAKSATERRPTDAAKFIRAVAPDQIKIAFAQADLDGPLVDYTAKGTKIELVGIEKVEDRDTYKIKLTTKDGNSLHVWIDAQTFLETKIEVQPRLLDGAYHPVEVYFRDYRQVSSLLIPFVIETRLLPVGKTAAGLRDTPVPVERITMEKVEVQRQPMTSRTSSSDGVNGVRSFALVVQVI